MNTSDNPFEMAEVHSKFMEQCAFKVGQLVSTVEDERFKERRLHPSDVCVVIGTRDSKPDWPQPNLMVAYKIDLGVWVHMETYAFRFRSANVKQEISAEGNGERRWQ